MDMIAFLVLILCGLSNVLSCQHGLRSPISNTNCRAYSECYNGHLVVYFCQQRTYFDPDSLKCINTTKCMDRRTYCDQDIVYLHPRISRIYYICTGDRLSARFCLNGERFDTVTNLCKPDADYTRNFERFKGKYKSMTKLNDANQQEVQIPQRYEFDDNRSIRDVFKLGDIKESNVCSSKCRKRVTKYLNCTLSIDIPPHPQPTKQTVSSTTKHSTEPPPTSPHPVTSPSNIPSSSTPVPDNQPPKGTTENFSYTPSSRTESTTVESSPPTLDPLSPSSTPSPFTPLPTTDTTSKSHKLCPLLNTMFIHFVIFSYLFHTCIDNL